MLPARRPKRDRLQLAEVKQSWAKQLQDLKLLNAGQYRLAVTVLHRLLVF